MSGLNEETKVQRNYKDTVFRMLFRDSMNLLSLYNRAEAIAMSIYEYNEEQHLKSEREQAYRSGKIEGLEEGKREGLEEGKREGLEEGKREGIAEGRREGMKEGLRMGESRLAKLLQILSAEGRDDDIRRAVSDQMCRERLYQEKRL